MHTVNNNAEKTAITRRKISRPMSELNGAGLISGDALDYGCGKGFCASQLGMDKFDPFYYPDAPGKQYDTVVCQYVLNVVEQHEEGDILEAIKGLLKPSGKAYIIVRRDVKKDGKTKRGTFQRDVNLGLPIWKERKGAYCVYELKKGDL